MQTSNVQSSRPSLGSIVWGIVLNAIIPVILYKLSKRYFSNSELTALVIATTFPLGKSIFDLVRRGQLDPVSIVVQLGIVTDGVALLFGGSPCWSENPCSPARLASPVLPQCCCRVQ